MFENILHFPRDESNRFSKLLWLKGVHKFIMRTPHLGVELFSVHPLRQNPAINIDFTECMQMPKIVFPISKEVEASDRVKGVLSGFPSIFVPPDNVSTLIQYFFNLHIKTFEGGAKQLLRLIINPGTL